MKRIAWITVAAAVVAYFANSHATKKARREVVRVEEERKNQTTKTAVSQMTLRTNAVSDWEASLSNGKRFRLEPILTIELEKLWLQQRPILFTGPIRDIATRSESEYAVSIDKAPYSRFMFMGDLQLSLHCNKSLIDSLLDDYPDLFKNHGRRNSVAVVAHVNSISSFSILDEEGYREEIKVGDGELLDIIYIGDVTF